MPLSNQAKEEEEKEEEEEEEDQVPPVSLVGPIFLKGHVLVGRMGHGDTGRCPTVATRNASRVLFWHNWWTPVGTQEEVEEPPSSSSSSSSSSSAPSVHRCGPSAIFLFNR